MVEALAAFAIVALLTLLVQRGFLQSRIALAALEDRSGAERVASSLLAEPLRPADVEAGGRRGSLDGYPFEIRLLNLDLPFPESEPPGNTGAAPTRPAVQGADPAGAPLERPRWRPFRQIIVVTTARGGQIRAETVKLGPVE